MVAPVLSKDLEDLDWATKGETSEVALRLLSSPPAFRIAPSLPGLGAAYLPDLSRVQLERYECGVVEDFVNRRFEGRIGLEDSRIGERIEEDKIDGLSRCRLAGSLLELVASWSGHERASSCC